MKADMKKATIDPRTKLLVLLLLNITVSASLDAADIRIRAGMVFVIVLWMGAPGITLRAMTVYVVLSGVLRLCAVCPGVPPIFISIIAAYGIRFFPVLLFAAGFIATTKVSHLICAMQKLRVPKGIIIAFSVTMRFLPCVHDDFSRAKDAMRLRGIAFSAPNLLRHPLRTFEYALVPFMLRCAAIADELSQAALVRGIENTKRSTSIAELRLTWVDGVVMVLFSGLTLLVLIKDLGVLGK
jgi:energy-coupling factor transport system permease protein